MATNTSKLSVSELDFDNIKQALVTYLQSQDEFTDYNFEGASMNVLMDVLSYNTHMNSYMANMMGNEMFLDSGSIRQSVVSKAKEIGYTPRSVRSSVSNIDISVPGVVGAPQYITMTAGTVFDNEFGFSFSTNKDYLLYPLSGTPTTYRVQDVNIYDGNYVEFNYTVDSSDPDQRFIIPSENVDMTTLRVIVKPSIGSSTKDEYTLNDDLNRLAPDSLVFFTHETPEGYYEVTFGDGILGNNVINGNYIILSYIVAVGKDKANYISDIDPVERIDGYTGYAITVNEPSYGGSEKESLAEIKFRAPKMFQSQRRAVTLQDYETFILQDYPFIDTINSWGGEDNNPPIYGKVFFAIKPKHTEFLSTKLKEEIIDNLIKNYNVVTIVPEIIDPDYIYLNIDTTVYYNRSRTTTDESQLVVIVNNTIYDYFTRTTEKFKMDFKFSPLTTEIDGSDPSFDSSLSNITMHKRIYPIQGSKQTFNIAFNNSITPNTIESSHYNTEDTINPGVSIENRLMDDGNGKIKLVNTASGVVIDANIGTVDYNTGEITVTIFPYTIPLDTLDIRIYAVPQAKNVISGYNQIIIPDNTSENIDLNRKQGVSVQMATV